MPMGGLDYRKLHFDWKHRLIAAMSRRMNFTYTIRHGLAAGLRRRGGCGFVPWPRKWTPEERFFWDLDLRDTVVYDIGSFEGLLAMFFSRTAPAVVAWEPNPVSREKIAANLRLNGIQNVVLRDVGLSDVRGECTIAYDPLMPGAASAAASVAGQIRDTASRVVEQPIRTVRLDDDVREQSLPAPGFIKIDVEGMELSVLRGAESTLKTFKPALFLELHGSDDRDKRRNAREIASALWDVGYRDIMHVETGARLTPVTIERPSHIFCAA
jgi:FkbM family methyltransferase